MIQAYRLEPLINPLYAQVKPVKIDSASGKMSKKAKDLAEGPKIPEAAAPAKESGWTQSLFSAVMKVTNTSFLESSSKPVPPDKVS